MGKKGGCHTKKKPIRNFPALDILNFRKHNSADCEVIIIVNFELYSKN